ncbi:MAG: UvrD-helicase domain-containing protein [Nitrospiraceae bacterium]|nr:UvrD-helicase domain-containing protein [Nitrospiraceae bacterium]
MTAHLRDSAARTRAATATDRNIVVTAGAGTGKTTLLVDRLMYLLLDHSSPLDISEVVALTFTNKAANEMKGRLRAELNRRSDNPLAVNALRDVEKSQIGTIHSFAAHLLRLYPVESGVDPFFQQDEGPQFKEHFYREWTLWLDAELGPEGAHHDLWSAALGAASLEVLQDLAMRLAGELIPLEERAMPMQEGSIPSPIQQWLLDLARTAEVLRKAHPKTQTLERMLQAAASLLRRAAHEGLSAVGRTEDDSLDREVPGITAAWSKPDHTKAKHIIRTAQALAKVRTGPLAPLLHLMATFGRDCRRRFVQDGYISFDGLLARSRTLLRDFPSIRRELKTQFRAILVDEFQDTDPVQYEMILYLAEAPGHEEADWRRIRLDPGKLFIVGDPKQSIYAFRRADMEAYDAVVEDHVLAQTPPGERHTLQTNFRSHAGLLTFINRFFSAVFPEQAVRGLQPSHEPLEACESNAIPLSGEGVILRVARSDEPDADTEGAGRAEAEALARWLSEDVLGREEIRERDSVVKIKPGHVAILFRNLTGVREYVEALRRYDIPCLAEGEKHFYERQEIIDTVNLLRAVVSPHDSLALVGVLRSSLGAVPDVELEALAHHGLLDYRTTGTPPSTDHHSRQTFERILPLYTLLRELNRRIFSLPLTEAMDFLFSRAPLAELAAASADHEQALANLFRLRDIVAESAQRADLTLHGMVAELTGRVNDPPDESESSLLEDTTDGNEQGAVRLLSIHKAKGLEFPVVIVAGLHRGTDRQEPRAMVQHDWSSGVLGVRLGDWQTVGGMYVGAKLAERQRYESSRVLYVAMTRAKRRLILSAGLPARVASDSFLACVAEKVGFDVKTSTQEGEASLPFGDGVTLRVSVVSMPARRRRREAETWHEIDDDFTALQARWHERDRRREEGLQSPLFTNPSALKKAADERTWGESGESAGLRSESARLIGTLAHRILEEWDFAGPPDQFTHRIDTVCRYGIPSAFIGEAPSIMAELRNIFRSFSTSPVYTDISRATILGREMPFAIPWPKERHEGSDTPKRMVLTYVMEGSIDLVYRLEGRVWIIDYKTDRVDAHEIKQRAEVYRLQARVYCEAVSRCLGLGQVGFQCVFLRHGIAVPMSP